MPLISRIIAVADAYEAMISDRAYRRGVSHELAVEELIKNSRTQFDPCIVNHFLNSYSKINWTYFYAYYK